MKKLKLITTFILLFSSATSMAAKETCQFNVGPKSYTTSGNTIIEARSTASEMCFDKHLEHYEAQRGELPSDETADLMINSCVNIKCS